MFLFQTIVGICVITLYIAFAEARRATPLQKRSPLKYTRRSDILEYLSNYGYFDDLDIDSTRLSIKDISDSIKDIQENLGLNETGVLDRATLKVVNLPRCANKDVVARHHHSLEFQKLYKRRNESHFSEKYSLYGTKWNKDVITYQITRYSQQRLSHQFIDEQLQAAFRSWEEHVPLRFVPAGRDESEPDIEIEFTYGEHGDNFPFHPGTSQLAHAFYPGGSGLSGDIHFNDEVNWTQENMLYYTALHEIGHTLGLRHSSNQNSIMFSHLILDVKHAVSLNEDDISGVQQIYGKSLHVPQAITTETPTTSIRPTSRTSETNILQRHQICQDGKFDAITQTSRGKILVFRGEEMITLNQDSKNIQFAELQLIRNVYNGRIPAPIDAAFTLNHKTYLFKGSLYWRTSGFVVDQGYPKVISRNFQGIPGNHISNLEDSVCLCWPENLNAAFVGEGSKQVYFMKDSEFWDYDLTNKMATRHEIRTHWKGVPYDRIDAAYSLSNGTTFMFREGRYWKLSLSSQKFTATPESHYPRDNRLWFSCTNFKPSFAKL